MVPIISLFNHKGGVSKTTTAFNLGWAMADRGRKVLVVDGDPQCNLTGTILGFDGISDFSDFYAANANADINSCLDPIFRGTGAPLVSAAITATPQPNLFLLAGNIDLAENETQISVALSTSAAIPALQNIPGAVCALLRLTAEANGIDFVIVDMSPSVGALNQCFLMGSDYFIVPTSPDYYCNQAISSLSRVLPRWNAGVFHFRNPALLYPFPNKPPKVLRDHFAKIQTEDGESGPVFPAVDRRDQEVRYDRISAGPDSPGDVDLRSGFQQRFSGGYAF